MPNFTIYIRKEDEAKWTALDNKSEFLHNALNPTEITKTSGYVKPQKVDDLLNIPGIKRASEAKIPAEQPLQVNEKSHNYSEPVTYKKTGNWGA